MKKSLLALGLTAALALASYSANAGLAHQGYLGLKGGWAFLGNTDTAVSANQFVTDNWDVSGTFNRKNGFGIGIFGGYNITNWFGIEGGFNYFDGFRYKWKAYGKNNQEINDSGTDKLGLWNVELAARLFYTFDQNGSDIYFRAGGAYFKATHDGDDGRGAPLIGIGANYHFNRNFAVRAGVDYYFRAVNESNAGAVSDDHPISYKAKSDVGFVNVGFMYTFGGAGPAPVQEQTRQVTKTHTLDAGVLFPFDGSKLSTQGQQVVADVVNGSRNMNNVNYEVYGYTDRLGSDAYNQKLSERRANSVASEMVKNGVTQDQLRTIQGRGKANSITGNKCDKVKGRKNLINCLAPDRRVEVVVNGVEVVTEPAK